jgi:hypothetical protein
MVVICLRPEDDKGREILGELEKQTEIEPEPALEDGTRRYHLTAEGIDLHAFDPMLDKIDADWRDHIENWRGERRDYPPGD